jgi:hypothetical protein
MVPGNLLGLALFVLAVTPGYIYLRVAERRAPRPERSPLLLTVELVVIGTGATLLTVLGIAVTLRLLSVQPIDVDEWLRLGSVYASSHLLPLTLVFCVVILLSNLGTGLVAYWLHKGKRPGFHPGGSVWTEIMTRDAGKNYVFLSLQLKNGGKVEGYLHSFALEKIDSDSEIALQPPIFVAYPGEGRRRAPKTQRLIVSRGEVAHIAVSYEPVTNREVSE